MSNQPEQPPATVPPGEPAGGAKSPIQITTRDQPDIPRDPLDAPVRRLTITLIGTYKGINKVYYDNKRRVKEREAQGVFNDGHDDEHYDYKIVPHERLNDRYEVSKKLGKGSFGQVVRCQDSQTNARLAVKIIKSRRPFFRQAQTEISLLKHLNKFDEGGEWNIVRITDTFVHKNHQCIVFEMLSYNLYELLRNTSFRGVSLNLVRKFARQILKTLAFLAIGCVDIIHCDLKPENILLRNHKHSAIKVIDFGSSCKSANRMYTYIQSRFYRSPEVMLGLPYTVAIDMWSLACILAEMHSGEPLFSGRDEYDQMQRIISMLGMPPARVLKGASKRSSFFDRTVDDAGDAEAKRAAGAGSARSGDRAEADAAASAASAAGDEEYVYPSVEATEEVTDNEEDDAGSVSTPATTDAKDGDADGTAAAEGTAAAGEAGAGAEKAEKAAAAAGSRNRKRKRMRKVTYRVLDKGSKYRLSKSRRSKTLASVIGMLTGGPHGRRRGEAGHDEAHYRMFYSLLCGMLRYEAGKRTRPLDALRHPFFADTDFSYFETALAALELATRHEMRVARKLLYRFRTTRSLHDSLLEQSRKAATEAKEANESALKIIDAMCPWGLTKISNTTSKHKDLAVLLSIERYRVLRRFMPAFAAEARRIGEFADPDGGNLDGKEVIIVPKGGESAVACPDGVPGSGSVDTGSGTSSVVVVAKPAGEAETPPAPTPGVRTRPTHVAHDGYNKGQDPYNRALSVFKWLKVKDDALNVCMHEAKAARMLVYGKGTTR